MRRESKPGFDVPKNVSFPVGEDGDCATGWIVGLSIASVELESLQTPALGCAVEVRVELDEGEVALGGRA